MTAIWVDGSTSDSKYQITLTLNTALTENKLSEDTSRTKNKRDMAQKRHHRWAWKTAEKILLMIIPNETVVFYTFSQTPAYTCN